MIVYNHYTDNQDYTWYDSSNVIFSKCYDRPDNKLKSLKIVFKNGRTYVYHDVEINDYLSFKTAESNGKAVTTYIIKKYQGVRITDTDTVKLEELKQSFIEDTEKISETPMKEMTYNVDFDENNGEFLLKLNNKVIYHSIENQVSLFTLFKTMNIGYTLNVVDKITYETDENNDEIKLN